MYELYNAKIKEKFLKTNYTNPQTERQYRYVLHKAKYFEEIYGIDIFLFNKNQIEEVLLAFGARSTNSLSSKVSILRKYIEWATQEGYCPPNIAIIDVFSRDLVKYINKVAQKNMFITREEMYDICNQLYNYSDQGIIVALFEGIKGSDNEELRNLKPNDIKPVSKTIIATKDDGTTRTIYVPDERSIDILIKASKENVYHKGNGELESNSAIMPLKDSPYLFRSIKRKDSNDEDKIKSSTVSLRFVSFKNYLSDYKFLTPNSVHYSGMFDRCLKIEKENGEILKEDFIKVYNDFGMNKTNWWSLKNKYEKFKNNLC